MLLSLLNIRANVTEVIVHAVKNSNFLLTFLMQVSAYWKTKKSLPTNVFVAKTVNTIDFNKACDRGIMNLVYQKIMNKNMGIKESRNYI